MKSKVKKYDFSRDRHLSSSQVHFFVDLTVGCVINRKRSQSFFRELRCSEYLRSGYATQNRLFEQHRQRKHPTESCFPLPGETMR